MFSPSVTTHGYIYKMVKFWTYEKAGGTDSGKTSDLDPFSLDHGICRPAPPLEIFAIVGVLVTVDETSNHL